MFSRLLLTVGCISALVLPQVAISDATTATDNYRSSQQYQYNTQTCDPVNDPSTCRPG